jgi:hypothetical protein
MNRGLLLAILLTYLIVSFVPALALPSLMGRGKTARRAA